MKNALMYGAGTRTAGTYRASVTVVIKSMDRTYKVGCAMRIRTFVEES
jgi:hypothetical protein